MVKIIAAIFLAAILAGCSTTGGTFCDISQPHRFSDAAVDAMTDAEVNQELIYNEQGVELCGWKV